MPRPGGAVVRDVEHDLTIAIVTETRAWVGDA